MEPNCQGRLFSAVSAKNQLLVMAADCSNDDVFFSFFEFRPVVFFKAIEMPKNNLCKTL